MHQHGSLPVPGVKSLGKRADVGVMHLSAAMLADIVCSLRSSVRGGMEKRQKPRVGLRAQARYVTAGRVRDEAETAWVRDISTGGVGLLCRRELPAGTTVSLMLEKPGAPDELVACTVAYCRKASSSSFTVGLRFNQYKPKRLAAG
jgi:hypothetical protein